MRTIVILMLLAGGAAAQEHSPQELRQICADAMNADPKLKADIQKSIDNAIDQQAQDALVKAHEDAQYHIQKNERHVILAYAAMWVIAAGFLVFMWRRQQALVAQIDLLKKDLEAAGKESK